MFNRISLGYIGIFALNFSLKSNVQNLTTYSSLITIGTNIFKVFSGFYLSNKSFKLFHSQY